jgi:hypothetical protein
VPLVRRAQTLASGAVRVLWPPRDPGGAHQRRRGVRDLPDAADAIEEHLPAV